MSKNFLFLFGLLVVVFISGCVQSSQNEPSLFEQQVALCGNGVCDYGEGVYLECDRDCEDFSEVECTSDEHCPPGLICGPEAGMRCVLSRSPTAGPCNPREERCIFPK